MNKVKDLIKTRINKKIKKNINLFYGILFVLSIIITVSLCHTITTVFDANLNVLGNLFVWGMGFIFFLVLQILIPMVLTQYAFKKEIKLLLKENLKELEPISFHTNWETKNLRKYTPLGCVVNVDKDTGYIYFCKERMDNYAHYYVIDTMYSDERMYVVQKAYDDTNNIPRILREVKVNKFIQGFKG